MKNFFKIEINDNFIIYLQISFFLNNLIGELYLINLIFRFFGVKTIFKPKYLLLSAIIGFVTSFIPEMIFLFVICIFGIFNSIYSKTKYFGVMISLVLLVFFFVEFSNIFLFFLFLVILIPFFSGFLSIIIRELLDKRLEKIFGNCRVVIYSLFLLSLAAIFYFIFRFKSYLYFLLFILILLPPVIKLYITDLKDSLNKSKKIFNSILEKEKGLNKLESNDNKENKEEEGIKIKNELEKLSQKVKNSSDK